MKPTRILTIAAFFAATSLPAQSAHVTAPTGYLNKPGESNAWQWGFVHPLGQRVQVADPTMPQGTVLALVSVGSIGYAGAFGRRHAGEYEAVTMTSLQLTFSAGLLLVLMFLIEGAPSDVSTLGWVLILEMAIFATAMPFFIEFSGPAP